MESLYKLAYIIEQLDMILVFIYWRVEFKVNKVVPERASLTLIDSEYLQQLQKDCCYVSGDPGNELDWALWHGCWSSVC